MLSHFSHVRLFATPWTVAGQAPLSMGFSRKNSGMGCHALLQGNFPTGVKQASLTSPVLAGGSLPLVLSGKPISSVHFSRSVVSNSLWPHGLEHARLPYPSGTPIRDYSNINNAKSMETSKWSNKWEKYPRISENYQRWPKDRSALKFVARPLMLKNHFRRIRW